MRFYVFFFFIAFVILGTAQAEDQKPIVRHIRASDLGDPFSVPPTPDPSKVSQRAGAIKNEIVPSTGEKGLPPILKHIPLKCLGDKTERIPLEVKQGIPESKTFDYLILRKNEVPEEADLIFGKNVVVIPFDENHSSIYWVPVADLNATCLPFRVRFVGKTKIVYEGRDALKNFDNNPHGEFHEFIKEHYFGKVPKK